jgi:hypothetical protein
VKTASCGKSRDAGTCVACIKESIGTIDSGSGVVCSLADVAQICGIKMDGKTQEETVACEKQLKKHMQHSDVSLICGVNMERKTKEETVACEQQLQNNIAQRSRGKGRRAIPA